MTVSAIVTPFMAGLKSLFSGRPPGQAEAPLRAELFSADQMAQHGRALAAAHRLAPDGAMAHGADRLLARLAANETTLVEVCKQMTSVASEKRRITPAGEWLLDNFYLIEEQIRTAKRHLPKGYSRELPRLAGGPSAGHPRVYDIALETVAHGDGRVDTETLYRFVAAYQSVIDLRLGELWAIPIMLRLAVIENLRRVAVQIAAGSAERDLAALWAERMIDAAERDPKGLILVIADMARSSPPMVSAFVAELARRLQGRGPALALPLTWVEQHLAESGQTIAQQVQLENQQQAADQVSISNSIGSLRVIGAMDWRKFVETLSVVERALLDDPQQVYGGMDFASRDRYRHATERIARQGNLDEGGVARHAVALARAAAGGEQPAGAAAHVGHYLIGDGLPQLERQAQVRHSFATSLRRVAGRCPLFIYLGAIALATGLFDMALLRLTAGSALPLWSLLLLSLPLSIVGSQLALSLVNWLAGLQVMPQPLPKMDYSEGIPADCRTLVVVPTMLVSPAGVDSLVEALEVRFLANRDPHVCFALLGDFLDAAQESLPADGELLQLAVQRIDELNAKYRTPEHPGPDNFFLLHRPRRWNPQENAWMGHERKRGKLAELNALLRSGEIGGFLQVAGDVARLVGIRYVITLDTDTQLPRDAARQFVGAMAHPLNRPRYDAARQRVVSGYGILQPRVAVSLPGTNRSRLARLYGGEPGIDPYTRAVSDVYQDVFGEGSFIGKGIYDVDAFEQALANRFPENRILSHDLLEGCYARAGLLSDVQLYEDSPASYRADVLRRQRWMRGDWQLAGWLLRRVPGEGCARRRNPLSALSQWKLFDNLRRSLLPVAITALLLVGWLRLPAAGAWTLGILGSLLLPPLLATGLDLCRKPEEVLFRQHLAAIVDGLQRHVRQLVFEIACLPYEALLSLDAIGRTAWRLLVSQRHLLEWNPSSEVERQLSSRGRSALAGFLRLMWVAPVLAVATALYLACSAPPQLAAAAPLLLLWLLAPATAWWLSRPLGPHRPHLDPAQHAFLRRIARRTWGYFEHFVGPDDNWLAPDNYQEYRVAALAHRTSPTNMGLALLANLAAYDFGYIPAGGLLRRTDNTLQTMQGLARYRGHFYNWYDTQTLQPMPVLYISTVDSGNLAGHLLTLRSGLLAVADEPLLATGLFDGLGDTLGLLAECADDRLAGALAAFRKNIDLSSALPPQGLPAWRGALLALRQGADELVQLTRPGRGAHDELLPEGEAASWARAIVGEIDASLLELDLLAPWLSLPPAPAGLAVFAHLPGNGDMPSLRQLAAQAVLLGPDIARQLSAGGSAGEQGWLQELSRCLALGSAAAADRLRQIDNLARQSGELAEMDYGFLFDHARHLLTIGYNVADRRVDTSYYDLLASEARLCNFVAIAQGQLPQESWFSLGRLLTGTGGEPALLSWSGSMFEYLMPMLVMPNYDNTLLDQTCKAAVARQIEYGRQRGVPWGISESGYNTVDVHLNYQYRAFGVPGLGLKRGLADDLVIAPYASALALMVAPEAACHNLQRLAGEGCVGQYGFFEAIDYTPARQRRGQSQVMVRSFMAHHQGMSLLALDYLLQGQPMQKRFMADRLFQAIMLLLQERIPRVTTLFSHTAELADARASVSLPETPIRVFTTADTPVPEVQLLSNGRYHVMLTNAGGGYSRWNDLAVTRWREDGTRDHHGTFCYIRELASGTCWSTSFQPTLLRPAHYEAIFSEGRAEFRRRDLIPASDSEFETYSEIVVSPEDDIEIRRTRITNRGKQRREIDVTSYGEVVMAAPAADALHPAFSNLFVESEIVDQRHAILCSRRPRSIDEKPPWMLHLMAVHGIAGSQVSYETDRLRFIGRGNSTANAQAMRLPSALSGTAGSVLDPVVAIRHRFMLAPEQSVTIDLVTGVAESRAQALALVEKYQDRHLADRVFDLTWTHSQVVLRQLNASEADAQLYARLAGSVIHAHAALRAEAEVLVRNRRGQSGLWGYAISGDLPIVLLQIGDAANIDLVRQVVQAHAYWRLKGLTVDLVIWNEDHAGYRQRLQEQIMGLIASGIEASVIDRPGGIFVRQAEQISGEDRILLQSVARAVITDCRGSLAEQLDQRKVLDIRVPRLLPSRRYRPEAPVVAGQPGLDLQCFNGLGGFAADGREYVITLVPGQATPAPWANVLANPGFGTVISESGSAYTWSENAHEFRLTPWANDPVGDAGGEAIYLRDEETGQVWSPTPWPVPAPTPYVVRHGFGYSEFATQAGGIHSELRVFVAVDDPVKFSVLTLHNRSGRARRLSATAYVEWVLGDLRARSAMHINSEVAPGSGALYARNPYSTEFAEQVAFFDIDDAARSVTGDRAEFLGRNGSPQAPAALQRTHLSGRVGAGLDPCGAIQLAFDLADGESREIVFRLGVGRNVDSTARLVQRYRGSQATASAFAAVGRQWQKTLGAVQIETPDPAFNLLANGWLVYQTLACRLWARSGYYQSGGAFGFRDQLQDVMALVHAEPALVRAQLLLSAGRQFVEGDVQHWWHPPSGRGVRTRCSDDYLWLPLAVCRYVGISGDRAILDERRDFLEGRPVNAEDDSYYDLPGQSGQSASLYEHCVRAIRHGLRFGSHGLPLMGSGDWNDGMNRVGVKGQGESVWLGFFLCEVLHDFGELARLHGDPEFADFCQSEAHRLGLAIEAQGWDGAWYRRAYFDDGQPLGASQNEECQIDSIAQSWSVLSGVAPARRAWQAMQSLDARLVDRAQGLVQLLDPPFDLSSLDPGYIRGYVPGVRENGGQYTHAAIWAAMAFARQGDTTRAWELATMINPLSHAGSPAAVARYKVEPYVMAADVYARAPHAGRGGWTWYTGSAGWMYRLLLESLLGLRRQGDKLHFAPCLPADWSGFTVHYRYRATRYHITVSQGAAGMDADGEGQISRLRVDGVAQAGEVIELVDDAVEHHVELRFTPPTVTGSGGW